MKPYFLVFSCFLSVLIAFGQKTVTINGFAPDYVGSQITINGIEDYLSMKEVVIASTTVKADSTFSTSFFIDETQKVKVRGKNNSSFLYIQPNATYQIYLPSKNPNDPDRPNGNQVELSFFQLDSNDINYKILRFLRWQDDFLGRNYYLKNVKPLEFAKSLEEFKSNVENYYKKDTSDFYLNTFVRFSVAKLDDIQTASERNRYEKYDFYLKHSPISYKNDSYMGYINSFYEKMNPRLHMEINNRVYLSVLKSSPSLMMNALGQEYTLKNLRLREIVMIKMLTENFYSNEYPQTNILSILDSVSKHSLFEANGIIAKNAIIRLTELVPGGKAPDFVLKTQTNETKTLANFKEKYIYLHFIDPEGQKSLIELEPLKELQKKYKDDVAFVSFIVNKNKIDTKKIESQLPWESYVIDLDHSILKNYKISTYPSYVLIDETGYLVAAPALSPLPNGEYETIDKTFYYIHDAREKLKPYRK